jgi:hypothetical protein
VHNLPKGVVPTTVYLLFASIFLNFFRHKIQRSRDSACSAAFLLSSARERTICSDKSVTILLNRAISLSQNIWSITCCWMRSLQKILVQFGQLLLNSMALCIYTCPEFYYYIVAAKNGTKVSVIRLYCFAKYFLCEIYVDWVAERPNSIAAP